MPLPDLAELSEQLGLPPGAKLQIAQTPPRAMTAEELSGLRAGVSPMALIRSLDDKGQFVPGVGSVRGDGHATVGPARIDYFDAEQLLAAIEATVERVVRRVLQERDGLLD